MTNDLAYFPILVPDDLRYLDTTEPSTQVLGRWSIFDGLSPEKKNILTHPETPKKIFALEKLYGLDRQECAKISQIIRWLVFGQLQKEESVARLQSILAATGKDPAIAQEISDYLKDEVFTLIRLPGDTYNGSLSEGELDDSLKAGSLKLPLLKALADYPKLGEQVITEGRIRVKSEPEPVRGTLRHWIRSYRDAVGIGNYDPLVRGRFIFNHDNTRRLSGLEQEKLAMLFKSLEEETLLDIDPTRPAILFPAPKPKPKPAPAAPRPGQPGSAPAFRPVTFPPIQQAAAKPTPPLAPAAPQAPIAPQPSQIQQETPSLRIGFARHNSANALRDEQAARFGHGIPLPTADMDEPSIRFSTDHILPSETDNRGGHKG